MNKNNTSTIKIEEKKVYKYPLITSYLDIRDTAGILIGFSFLF